jgi:hypothetical protein
MEFIIVGEDELARIVIKRLIAEHCPNARISRPDPARGGEIESLVCNYNLLARKYPIFILVDEDGDCAPGKINRWFQGQAIHANMLFRVAVDEVESWLLADRPGMADFLGVPPSKIPVTTSRRNDTEISFSLNYKSSLYLMKDIVPYSRKSTIKQRLLPRNHAKKGPEYNSTLKEFIPIWDIEKAAENSSSLQRTITRIKQFCQNGE